MSFFLKTCAFFCRKTIKKTLNGAENKAFKKNVIFCCNVEVFYTIIKLGGLKNEKTIEREFRPFSKIKDHYPRYIITMDQFDRSRDGVKHINLLDFLTDEADLA